MLRKHNLYVLQKILVKTWTPRNDHGTVLLREEEFSITNMKYRCAEQENANGKTIL